MGENQDGKISKQARLTNKPKGIKLCEHASRLLKRMGMISAVALGLVLESMHRRQRIHQIDVEQELHKAQRYQTLHCTGKIVLLAYKFKMRTKTKQVIRNRPKIKPKGSRYFC